MAAKTIVRSRSCVRCSPLRAAAAISGSPPRGSKRTSLLDSRRDVEAIAALRRLRQLPGGMVRSWMYPRSYYLEAVALERLGQRARARESVDHLLALLRSADPDLPLLAEAKALRHRLAEAARPASAAHR